MLPWMIIFLRITHLGNIAFCPPKTIDSFHFASKILHNMFKVIALPRTRRPKPTSQRRSGFFVWMMK